MNTSNVLILISVVALIVVAQLMKKLPAPTLRSGYRRKDPFLSSAERSFFGVLCQACTGRYHIFVKVRLGDLFDVAPGGQQRQSAFNRIQSKHMDFILCDLQSISPAVAIELDDSSHQRRRTQDRDEFVNQLFHETGFPLIRIRAAVSYNTRELSRQIEDAANVAASRHAADSPAAEPRRRR